MRRERGEFGDVLLGAFVRNLDVLHCHARLSAVAWGSAVQSIICGEMKDPAGCQDSWGTGLVTIVTVTSSCLRMQKLVFEDW